jgi:hypothetical protein
MLIGHRNYTNANYFKAKRRFPSERRDAMTTQLSNHERGNDYYQRDLAEKLVGVMGFDGALDACRNNGWEGVVSVLLCGGAPKSDRAGVRGRR